MSKKKGLSLEEKRSRMMEIFFETKDVFQLKDIEKIAPKSKGITPMSVKEVLQSLVDDNMVDTERVGTSNYYWAFPSKALHARKRRLEELEKQLEDGSQRKKALQQAVDKAKVGREVNEEREDLLKELTALKGQRDQMKVEIEKYQECDPAVVEEIRNANIAAKEAVARWTGGTFGNYLISYLLTCSLTRQEPWAHHLSPSSGFSPGTACQTCYYYQQAIS
ncbi:meiotic nuclear division protein 1 homolog [Danio rerio]|uniref:Meiotic nuclear division protein 1 homolog n=1 Tax=Danio rerio TaxID=7955 RepID=MND1_DANRE|nr:meiotic nuclear division protein 1 homolog [Danio rerio]Q6DC61.1 RecName: Full=Meiotic nuclear division protein 1 homolog [Danio rerio]AAH78223.1 Zgc:101017 [Danio rerio]|eukprot:NP_001003597.1 meiotic nuclear division protein 1 homolog [Danio rerio]